MPFSWIRRNSALSQVGPAATSLIFVLLHNLHSTAFFDAHSYLPLLLLVVATTALDLVLCRSAVHRRPDIWVHPPAIHRGGRHSRQPLLRLERSWRGARHRERSFFLIVMTVLIRMIVSLVGCRTRSRCALRYRGGDRSILLVPGLTTLAPVIMACASVA